jgi:hypothetical protein
MAATAIAPPAAHIICERCAGVVFRRRLTKKSTEPSETKRRTAAKAMVTARCGFKFGRGVDGQDRSRRPHVMRAPNGPETTNRN